jgi:CheY-like chemotaxis protein
MLVDDDSDDNFFHERAIKKVDSTIIVIAKNSGIEALEYLKSKQDKENQYPDLIFLDINMPKMNGWDFLQEYTLLDKEVQSHAIIIMLTTSANPDDVERAKSFSVISDFIIKPLTKEIMENIIETSFKN